MTKISDNISLVNIAVGLNINDLSNVVSRQEEELTTLRAQYSELKKRTEASNAALANLVPGYAEAIGYEKSQAPSLVVADNTPSKHAIEPQQNEGFLEHSDDDIIYFSITRDQVEEAMQIAKEEYIDMYQDSQTKKLLSGKQSNLKAGHTDNHPNKLLSDQSEARIAPEDMILMPVNQHPFWSRLESDPEYKEEIVQFVMSKFDKAVHTHKKYAHNFTNLPMMK